MMTSTPKAKILLATLPTIALIGALEVLAGYGLIFPFPAPILIITVAYAAFNSGAVAGAISTAIVLVYEVFIFTEPGKVFAYNSPDTVRLMVGIAGTPATMFLVCALRKRVLARTYALARRQAHVEVEQLMEQEHVQLMTILEQLPFGVVIVKDVSCKVRFANVEATRLLGHDLSEFHPYGHDRMFHGNGQPYRPDEWPLIRSFQKGEIVEQAEFLYAGKGGHLRPMSGRSAPVCDSKGEVVAATMIFHDVSASRHAGLAQLELEAIVTTSDDAIFSLSLGGTILTWNPAAERIFGYTEEEIHGQSFHVLIAADRWDEITRMLEHVCQGERIARFETVGRTKRGADQPASVRLSPLLDASGHVKAATVIVRELSASSSPAAVAARRC